MRPDSIFSMSLDSFEAPPQQLSLLPHLSGYLGYSEWWGSISSDADRGVLEGYTLHLTWLILSASAREVAPSTPIWLSCIFKVVRVYIKWWSLVVRGHIVDLTWLIWSASATDLAPSSPIRLYGIFKVMSVYMHHCGWRCLVRAQCLSHSINPKRTRQIVRSFVMYLVVP